MVTVKAGNRTFRVKNPALLVPVINALKKKCDLVQVFIQDEFIFEIRDGASAIPAASCRSGVPATEV